MASKNYIQLLEVRWFCFLPADSLAFFLFIKKRREK